ncbi:MAG: 3-dehydroquinate synthase [Hyphomonadaceae bacterium]|nr:3-dehydroquinate synthase [Hyphomonadaceae bacterium]MBC6411974.1 3-dehydroquinate synthase [Hyphomonadaceae bacterium]
MPVSNIRQSVRVDLGNRSYPIHIGTGLLPDLRRYLGECFSNRKVHVVTDQPVHDLYRPELDILETDISITILPPGEAQKSFSTLQTVLDDMFSANLSRPDYVIAFGGGVIGDLTGFAASIYKRGCQFIQIPTTLLAQVDSSVGGKTAINVPQGKNLVGTFYQPGLVLVDTDVLSTLPERQVRAGYAEVLKYGLLGDRAFFDWLESNGTHVLQLDPNALIHAISVSCRTKARIVAEDERESGRRALLNLGHTFAHALEARAGYNGDLLHGEAVSAGMDMAFDYSSRLGLSEAGAARAVARHLQNHNMPTIRSVSHLLSDPDRLLATMMQDKKNEADSLTLVLARDIGDAFVKKGCNREGVLDYLKHLKHQYA